MERGPQGYIKDFCSRVFNIAAKLDLEENSCSKGVRLIFEELGIPYTRAPSAYMQQDLLPENGWIKLACNAAEAPIGAVLLFDRDNPPGERAGSMHGHIEIVTRLDDGPHRYVSDHITDELGGTVAHNFIGAYVHPSLSHLWEKAPRFVPETASDKKLPMLPSNNVMSPL